MNAKFNNASVVYQNVSLCAENRFDFIQSGLNRPIPTNTARAARQNLMKSFLLRYSPINHVPMSIMTRPRAVGVDIFGVKALDIQEIVEEAIGLKINQKNDLIKIPRILPAITPNSHFITDISVFRATNLPSIAINLASTSFRKSLISWRRPISSFSRSFLIADSYSRRSALVASSAVSCEFFTAVEKAFAWASGIPASLSVSTNCNVSNVTTAIANTSCLQILAQDFLCSVYTRKAVNEGEYCARSLI